MIQPTPGVTAITVGTTKISAGVSSGLSARLGNPNARVGCSSSEAATKMPNFAMFSILARAIYGKLKDTGKASQK